MPAKVKPAAMARGGPRYWSRTGKSSRAGDSPSPVLQHLRGDDEAIALGITVESNAYRGETLCLHVRAISVDGFEAARAAMEAAP